MMVEHIWSLSSIQLKNACLTIGTFDGIHLGHQAILNNLRAGAHAVRAPAVVLTFHPHPAVLFGKRSSASSLTTPDERAALIGELGIDYLITHPFNLQTAGTTAQEFISILKSQLGFTWLGVGEDFALGKGRQGDVNYLRTLGQHYEYQLQVFSPIELDGQVISSSRIRTAVAEGDVQTAARLLGREYRLSGKVIKGDGRGRTIGIPTANLLVNNEKLIPASGVYACRAYVGNMFYPAAVNIGVRPTFDGDQTTRWVEAHLLDFSSNLYGKIISLDFIDHLRGERRFAGVDELIEQIHRDIQITRDTVFP
jgi:riboflavin kinase/FMN adenylyltransferase